jgi:hypothetical protein
VTRETGRGKYRFKIRDLSADERCSQAILDFLSTADVERLGPGPAADGAQSGASEWELQERQERAEERRLEAEEAGAEVEERLQFFPTSSFMALGEEE